jgi:hypothetical protein
MPTRKGVHAMWSQLKEWSGNIGVCRNCSARILEELTSSNIFTMQQGTICCKGNTYTLFSIYWTAYRFKNSENVKYKLVSNTERRKLVSELLNSL